MRSGPHAAAEDVVLIRYNDPAAVREAVSRYGNELAAVIVEPILGGGGVIPAEPEFLRVVREETEQIDGALSAILACQTGMPSAISPSSGPIAQLDRAADF